VTVYCPNCGKPNTDEATKCIGCSTELAPVKKAPARFKGTMMMSGMGGGPAPGQPGGAPPAGGPAPAEPAPAMGGGPVQAGAAPAKKDLAFQATMLGPMTPPPGAAGFGAPPAPPAGGGGFGAPPAGGAPSGGSSGGGAGKFIAIGCLVLLLLLCGGGGFFAWRTYNAAKQTVEGLQEAAGGEPVAAGGGDSAGGGGSGGNSVCDKAMRCCEAYVEAMGGATAGLNPQQVCAGVQQAGAAGAMAEPACNQAMAAWRQSLDQVGKPVPDVCK